MRFLQTLQLVILIGIAVVGMSISSRTQANIIGPTVIGANVEINGSLPGFSLLGGVQDAFNVTRDLANGLDWLDWTLTLNLSFNTVNANLLQANQVLAGWRYAVRDDFLGLASSAGISELCIDSVCHFPGEATGRVDALMRFLGTTRQGLPEGGAETCSDALAKTGVSDGGFAVSLARLVSFSGLLGDGCPEFTLFDAPDLGISRRDKSIAAPFEGSALVRSTLTVVPIPPALPLFLTGLAGLGLLRRRRSQA